jgi:hypothetical protein
LRSERLTGRTRTPEPAVAVTRARHAAWQMSWSRTEPSRARWRAVATSRAVGAGRASVVVPRVVGGGDDVGAVGGGAGVTGPADQT